MKLKLAQFSTNLFVRACHGRALGIQQIRRLLVFAMCAGALGAQDGATEFKTRCAQCHDHPVGRVPAVSALRAMTKDAILNALGDPMIHKSILRAVNGCGSSWRWNESESLQISCLRRIDWSANSSLATIRASTAMNLPAYEPCSRQTRSRRVRFTNPWRQGQEKYVDVSVAETAVCSA
jgi:hypothetical protein